MLGFLFGTACLIGLIKVVKGHHGRGGWRRAMLRRMFERLDTTPGQEKVILAAIDSLEQAFGKAREQVRASRGTVADSIRGEHFDAATVEAAFGKNSASLDELHKAVSDALRAVHEALRPEQRRGMADLLAYGPRAGYHGCGGGHSCGPHGRWAGGGYGGGYGGGAVHL